MTAQAANKPKYDFNDISPHNYQNQIMDQTDDSGYKENSRYMNFEGIKGQTDVRLSETSDMFVNQVTILDNQHAIAHSTDSDDNIMNEDEIITPDRINKRGTREFNEKNQISEAERCLEESPNKTAKELMLKRVESVPTDEYIDEFD